MPGSKAPDFDAYGLLRATHSHFYAHIGAGPKVFRPPMSKLMLAKDLLTLASILYYSRI